MAGTVRQIPENLFKHNVHIRGCAFVDPGHFTSSHRH
jgi:hypothetical protein